MFRIILFLLLFCFSLESSLKAKIIEAFHLEEVEKHFDTLDANSLVMWDVDYTLIIPNDQVLHPINETVARELSRHYLSKIPQEKKHELMSLILSRNSFRLVDPKLPEIISLLQNRGIPVMAFTAMRTGGYGVIPSMENWRIHHLKQFHINFDNFFPQYSGLSWQEENSVESRPTFKAGILCSDLLSKGPVLDNFLKKINWKPTQVVFIDDTLDCLISVEATLNEWNIPFVGIHYQAKKLPQSSINMEIAHYQFSTLIEKGIWLTDQEASAYLQ